MSDAPSPTAPAVLPGRVLTLPGGETLLVPAELDAAVAQATFLHASVAAAVDRVVLALHQAGLILVPRARSRTLASVDVDLYSLALSWKAAAERRAAAAERELAALQALFVDPPMWEAP